MEKKRWNARRQWNIYFGISVSSGRENINDGRMIHRLLDQYGEVRPKGITLDSYFEDEDDWMERERQLGREGNVCARDLAWLDEADCMVAEMTVRSPGLGGEVYHAIETSKIPVLLLYREEFSSKMFLQRDHPLLSKKEYHSAQQVQRAVDDFFYVPEQPGRIFTIDGGDGAGKETQTRFLVEQLREDRYPVQTLDFPHDDALYGCLIRELLAGKHGGLKEVNPLFFAMLYAANRHDVKPWIDHWVSKGQNVVLDRYVEANWGHQASKMGTDDDRHRLIQQLQKLEWDWLGLPKSHRVGYLDLPIDYAETAMKNDRKRVMDIQEKDILYKEQVRKTFLWCSQQFDNWKVFDCLNPQGKRYTPEELHSQIYDWVKPDLVNQGDRRLVS